jgi:signal transduction histidine kinase
MAERITFEAQRLADMTKGLRSFALDEAAGGETDVNQVLLEALAFQEYEARRNSISVVTELNFAIPMVKAESGTLKQIFSNLITNAHQAMGSGGLLTIRTSSPTDDAVEIVISDTGQGIAPEIANRIFEPFFTTKSPYHGTGLGLYISKNLIQLVGGRIRVDSVKGSGTSFFVLLPACEYDSAMRI